MGHFEVEIGFSHTYVLREVHTASNYPMPISTLVIPSPVRLTTNGKPEARSGLYRLRRQLKAEKGVIVKIERCNPSKGTCDTLLVTIPLIKVTQRKRRPLR